MAPLVVRGDPLLYAHKKRRMGSAAYEQLVDVEAFIGPASPLPIIGLQTVPLNRKGFVSSWT